MANGTSYQMEPKMPSSYQIAPMPCNGITVNDLFRHVNQSHTQVCNVHMKKQRMNSSYFDPLVPKMVTFGILVAE